MADAPVVAEPEAPAQEAKAEAPAAKEEAEKTAKAAIEGPVDKKEAEAAWPQKDGDSRSNCLPKYFPKCICE